jgi:hypothetical protein
MMALLLLGFCIPGSVLLEAGQLLGYHRAETSAADSYC